jgi:hypothetical protein
MSTTAVLGLASPLHGPVKLPNLQDPIETLGGDQSSPIKQKRIPTTLAEVRTLPEATAKDVDDDFVQNHLSASPSGSVWWNERCGELVTEIQNTKKGTETEMYSLSCELLTGISEIIHGIILA